MKKGLCCICGEEIDGYGNDPWPVMDEGQCCNRCNMSVILEARLGILERKAK